MKHYTSAFAHLMPRGHEPMPDSPPNKNIQKLGKDIQARAGTRI